MTIERGQPWGEPGTLPGDGIVVRSDGEARDIVTEARRHGRPIPPLGLLGGDLCQTMGGRGDHERLRHGGGIRVPIDLGIAVVDGQEHCFVAHLVARRSWWWGRIFAAMNAQWLGRWNVATAGHPNDGRLDIFDVSPRMTMPDRRKARRRLPTGLHVPHPDITVKRSPRPVTVTFDRPLRVWLDGERIGRATTVTVQVEPDALDCYV